MAGYKAYARNSRQCPLDARADATIRQFLFLGRKGTDQGIAEDRYSVSDIFDGEIVRQSAWAD
jgi:hypothetical protein